MNRRLNKCRKKRNQRGFSLTEIIIVVLVILIVAAISIPNMVKAWYDSQLRTCAFEISDLPFACRLQRHCTLNNFENVCHCDLFVCIDYRDW